MTNSPERSAACGYSGLSDDAIVSKDLNGVVKSRNGVRAAERIPAQEMTGQPTTAFAVDQQDEEDHILPACERVRESDISTFATLHELMSPDLR